MTTTADPLSLGEGDTPLVELPRLAAEWGVRRLWAKAEWMNPTGSYKDRIAHATMHAAIDNGTRGWIGTSSGNGGAAMAAYGARAGLPGFLLVSADAPEEKLRSIVPYGVSVVKMQNMGLAVMDALRAAAERHRLWLTITAYAYNPAGMRGTEAIGSEIAASGDFTHVYVPTGGGGLLVAVHRGLPAAAAQPRLVCAQPAGCAPIVRCLNGEIPTPNIDSCTSSISGLQLPAPPDGYSALEAVSSSDGWGTSVTDDEALYVQRELARIEGVFVEPASAVALACVRRDLVSSRLPRDSRVVVVLTGSGLKDLRRPASSLDAIQKFEDLDQIDRWIEGRFTV